MSTKKNTLDDLNGAEAFALICGCLALSFAASCMNGWALQLMWGWFVVPATSWGVIHYWNAVGLAVLIGFIRFRARKEDADLEDLPKQIFGHVFITMFYLVTGCVVHALM